MYIYIYVYTYIYVCNVYIYIMLLIFWFIYIYIYISTIRFIWFQIFHRIPKETDVNRPGTPYQHIASVSQVVDLAQQSVDRG